MKITTIEEFYKEISSILTAGISKEIGHFTDASIADLIKRIKEKPFMSYSKRAC